MQPNSTRAHRVACCVLKAGRRRCGAGGGGRAASSTACRGAAALPRGAATARMPRHASRGAPGSCSPLSKSVGCSSRGAGSLAKQRGRSGVALHTVYNPTHRVLRCRPARVLQQPRGLRHRSARDGPSGSQRHHAHVWPFDDRSSGLSASVSKPAVTPLGTTARLRSEGCISPRPRCRWHREPSKRVCCPRPQAAREPCARCSAALQRHHAHDSGRRPQRGRDQLETLDGLAAGGLAHRRTHSDVDHDAEERSRIVSLPFAVTCHTSQKRRPHGLRRERAATARRVRHVC